MAGFMDDETGGFRRSAEVDTSVHGMNEPRPPEESWNRARRRREARRERLVQRARLRREEALARGGLSTLTDAEVDAYFSGKGIHGVIDDVEGGTALVVRGGRRDT